MLFHAFLLLAYGEKAFAPAATPGRMMPRGNAPIAPQQVGQRPMPQAVPPMQPVFEERSSAVLMASNVLFYSGLATLAAGAGMALRRSGAATTTTELTEVLAEDVERGAARTVAPVMYDIAAYDDVWGFEAKKEVYDKWDPEKPRNYENFNPFERNDENSMCDSNGCFPGQSRGYQPPNRPDVSWELMKEHNAKMDALKQEAKFNLKGKPGNFSRGWQKNLGATPEY
jgi:hypothetical protein